MSEQSARKHEEIPHHMQFFKWAQMNKLSPEAIGIINSYCHVPNKEVRHFFEKLMEYYNKQMLYEKKYYEEKERRRKEEEKKKCDREHHEEKKRRYYEEKKRRERAAAGPSHASAYVDHETARRPVDDIRNAASIASASSPRVSTPTYHIEDSRRHASTSSTSSPRVSTPSYHTEESRNHVNITYSSPRVSTPAYQPDDDDIQFICEQPSLYFRGSTDTIVKQEVDEAGPSCQGDVIADYPSSPAYHSPRTLTTRREPPVMPITKPAAAAAPSSKPDQRPTATAKPSDPQTSRPASNKPVSAPQPQKHVNFNTSAPAVRHIPRREDVPQPPIEPLIMDPRSVSVHAAPAAMASIMSPSHRQAPSGLNPPVAAKPVESAAQATVAASAPKPVTSSIFLPSSIKKEPAEPQAPAVHAVTTLPPVMQPSTSSLLPTRHIKTERLSALDEWASVEEVIGSPRPLPAATIHQQPPPTTSTAPAASPNDMQPIKTLRIKQEPIDATETTTPVHDPALVQILSSYLVKLNQQVNRLNVIKGQALSKKLQSSIFNSEVEELADPGVTFKMPYFKKLTDYVSAIIVKMSNEFKRLNVSPTSSLETSLQSVKHDVDKILRRAERAVQSHEGAGPSHQTTSSSKRKNSEENEGKNKKKRDDVSRSPDSTTH